METLNLKGYAHLGDAVYEVFVREKIIFLTSKLAKMHKINTSLVCAAFQCELLDVLQNHLTENEIDIVRRGRNIQISSARKISQKLHRLATGFEALIGYLYLNDKERLSFVFKIIDDYINTKAFSEN
jgi:ribonuclease-3 family protein